mmetsp:Transcript_31529/g.89966  ORF Transcript_31529/g.89966 Transcript_31529/m.89966 type:complete len:215 (+) Transcript_31529:186-830(+)
MNVGSFNNSCFLSSSAFATEVMDLWLILPSLMSSPTRSKNRSTVPSKRRKKAPRSAGRWTGTGSSTPARRCPTRAAHRFMCSAWSVVLCNRARQLSCSCIASMSSCSPLSMSRKMSPSVRPPAPGRSKAMPSVSRLKASRSWRSASKRTSASLTELLSCSCSTSRFRNLCTMSITSVRPVTSRIFWKPSSVFCDRSTCSNVIFCKEFPHNFSIA